MAERYGTDALFKALADPSRRKLLDLLHAHDGRTLNELCEYLDMERAGAKDISTGRESGVSGKDKAA